MNRKAFMERLEALLADIPPAEREEALDYYENYFDDAGTENETRVIRELGSPDRVAAEIKANLRESGGEYGEYTERGYEDARSREETQVPEKYRGCRRSKCGDRAKAKGTGPAILILILLVFLSPFLTGAVGGVLGVLVAIVLLPFLLIFGIGAAAFGLLAAAAVCIVTGFVILAGSPPAGLLTAGVGFLILSVGILFLILLLAAAGNLLPWILRKITEFCERILHRA